MLWVKFDPGWFWFNLDWFSISFVSYPWETKNIENQPTRLNNFNLKSNLTFTFSNHLYFLLCGIHIYVGHVYPQ